MCDPCGKCGCAFVKITPQKGFPIVTAALTCFECGSVVEYLDHLLIFSVRDALVSRSPKPSFVAQGGGAVAQVDLDKMPSNYSVARELILMGADNGLSEEEIAEVLNVDVEYARRIIHDRM